MSDWHTLDYQALRAAYAAGELTTVQVTAHYLERIAAHNPALRHYVAVDQAGAFAAAEESAARFASGTARALEGMPLAVKANIAVAGLSWNAGMALRANVVAERDAEAVRRLRAAGAIILGTANMHEAALGGTTDNPFYGQALNPHKAGHSTGGSSGGSGGAVAAGLCMAALGTDTLGSVRIPAAYNGVFGLKPSFGGVGCDGVVPLCAKWDCVGPLARSLDDLDDMLAVLSDQPIGNTGLDLRRILVLAEDIACEPAVVRAYEQAKAQLCDGELESLRLSDSIEDIRRAAIATITRELADYLGDAPKQSPDKISPELHSLLAYGGRRTEDDQARHDVILRRARAEILAALGNDGLLLTPTTPQAAFAHGITPPINQAIFTGLANVAGLPALSLPAGVDARGLPVAVQLIGPTGSEARLIAAARRISFGQGVIAPAPNFTTQ